MSKSKDVKGKHELQTVEQMAQEMAVPAHMTEAGRARAEALSCDIANTRGALQRALDRRKVDLEDPEEVKIRIDNYFEACEISATYPSWIGLCAKGLGISEPGVKQWMARHPNAETTMMIVTARDLIADILINQSLAGNASPVPTIFQLKNWYNHRDKVEVAQAAVDEDNLTAEEVRKKYAIVADYKDFKVVQEDSPKEDSRQEDSP